MDYLTGQEGRTGRKEWRRGGREKRVSDDDDWMPMFRQTYKLTDLIPTHTHTIAPSMSQVRQY